MTAARWQPAWPISASAPSTAATRPNTPTTCSRAASTAGASSASTSARRVLADTLGRQGGLYTRLLREDDRIEARVIGSIVSVVDSQDEPGAGARRAVVARRSTSSR